MLALVFIAGTWWLWDPRLDAHLAALCVICTLSRDPEVLEVHPIVAPVADIIALKEVQCVVNAHLTHSFMPPPLGPMLSVRPGMPSSPYGNADPHGNTNARPSHQRKNHRCWAICSVFAMPVVDALPRVSTVAFIYS